MITVKIREQQALSEDAVTLGEFKPSEIESLIEVLKSQTAWGFDRSGVQSLDGANFLASQIVTTKTGAFLEIIYENN